jgi:hypothetical protein
MGGEIKFLQYGEGVAAVPMPNDLFMSTTAFRPFVNAAAFVSAKGVAAAQTDAFHNTTTNTIDYFDGSVWVQLIDVNSAQVIAGAKTFSAITNFSNTTQSTDKDTGAVVIEGGLGVEKNVNIGGDVKIAGGLQVDGVTTYVNTTNLDVKDANVTLNKGGTQLTADDISGITVEMSDATHAQIIYDKDLNSFFKIGLVGNLKEVADVSSIQNLSNKNLNDTNTTIFNNASPTKLARIDAGSITAGQTRVVTIPDMDLTLLGTSTTQVITNKDIDGGTAANDRRITLPKDTLANLTALTRKAGTVVYDTTNNEPLFDNGTALSSMGGGGGGASGGAALEWNTDNGAALVVENGIKSYNFAPLSTLDGAQKNVAFLKVPDGYTAGVQIKLAIYAYSPSTASTFLIKTTTYLIRPDTEAVDNPTHSYASGNVAVANPLNTKAPKRVLLNITGAAGVINTITVQPGDFLRIEMERGTDTDAEDIRVLPAMEPIFS